jgi:hypothetical protein
MENPIKTSGAERTFQSGAHRDANTNKGRYDLLPTRAMREAALHFQHGGQKRGDRNWEQGMPLSQFLDSALRHLFAELEGPNRRAARARRRVERAVLLGNQSADRSWITAART